MTNPINSSKLIVHSLKSNLPQKIASVILAVFLIGTRFADASAISAGKIISLTNVDRINFDVAPLITNDRLTVAAYQKARDMVAQNYFDHYSPSGLSPWDFILSNSYDYSLAGENLAMDFASSEGINNAWLNSPTHARNILNKEFTDIGVAVVDGWLDGHPTTLVVQMFGRERAFGGLAILDLPLIKAVAQLLGVK